jgi:hypothetical protein
MRVSKTAILTLAVLIAQGFLSKASAENNPSFSPESRHNTSESSRQEVTEAPVPVVSIAPAQSFAVEPNWSHSPRSAPDPPAAANDTASVAVASESPLPPDDLVSAEDPATEIRSRPSARRIAPLSDRYRQGNEGDSQKIVAQATTNPLPVAEVVPPDDRMRSGPSSAYRMRSEPSSVSRGGSRTAPTPSVSPSTRESGPRVTYIDNPQPAPAKQLQQSPTANVVPSDAEVDNVQQRLRSVEVIPVERDFYRGSPSITIVNPQAFGADDFTGFVNATFQTDTRYGNDSDLDGAIGVGIGLGDATEAVGVEISYALASLGTNRDFGTGGFNVKVHRRLPEDFAIAVGWNGALNLGDEHDFKNSFYAVGSKIFRLREDISLPLSRLALSAGVGNGQFRTEDDVDDDRDTVGVFGSAALRVAEPVSLIVEWTGQDLAIGASLVPLKNVPFVITPAVRDITGAGDGARFVLGTGFSFKF